MSVSVKELRRPDAADYYNESKDSFYIQYCAPQQPLPPYPYPPAQIDSSLRPPSILVSLIIHSTLQEPIDQQLVRTVNRRMHPLI